jgi:uncharacterized protein (TIGR03435 family)
MAYWVQDFQVLGGPAWTNSERYNVEAKSEGNPAFNRDVRSLQLRRLQTLLRDRFKQALHRETKELPIYQLTVAKGGPKLQPPTCIQREPGDLKIEPGKTMMDYCGFGGFSGRGGYQASNASMAELAEALAVPLGRIVIDQTGITGRFRIQLTFTPDATVPFPDAPGGPTDAAATADLGPSIFTAIQEQLELKLESSKGPVEVLVIDHVERPSEN